MKKLIGNVMVIFLFAGLVTEAQPKGKGAPVTVAGLIIPRDDGGMYVRNSEGQFEVEWTKATRVALEMNTRLFRGLREGMLRYPVQSSKQVIEFPLPKGPITGIVTLRNDGRVEGCEGGKLDPGVWPAAAIWRAIR